MIGSILVLADDPGREMARPGMLAQATAETLRACFHASQVTLVPARTTILPLAAVIARALRSADAGGEVLPEAEPRTGRFVLYHAEDDLSVPATEWYPIEDLGGPIREAGAPIRLLTAEQAILEHPPQVVIALSPQRSGAALLSRFELWPRVLYFPTLLGDGLGEFLDLFGRWDPFDLERHWADREEPDEDPETGRSGDESLEPFVPFGLLVQLELSRGGEVGLAR